MSTELLVSAFAFLGILCGALSSYIVAARKMGGKVSSTEASQLWEEARKLREEATTRILQLEEKVEVLERRVTTLISENFHLRQDKLKYEAENRRLTYRIEEQDKKIETFRSEPGKGIT